DGEYNTSSKAFTFDANGANTGTALTSNLNAWQTKVDVDGNTYAGQPNGVQATGEGLKNVLEAFNTNKLVTDGVFVAWNTGGENTVVIDPLGLQPNTPVSSWKVALDHGVGGLWSCQQPPWLAFCGGRWPPQSVCPV